jgi:hypothetical protein
METRPFPTTLQLIQIIRPLLHHLPALREILSAVVSGPVRVFDGMGKLVLNEIRADLKDLIKDRPRHGPETMAGYPSRLNGITFDPAFSPSR